MAEPRGDGADSVGLPQLDFGTFPSQIFWLIVALVALYYIMSRVALPRIALAIEARHDAIEDDLDRAAEYKRRALEAERAYEKALAEAKREADAIAQKARQAIQKDVDAAIAKADAEIAARSAEAEARIKEIRATALESVEAIATETAEALVAALAPGPSSDAVRGAVSARVAAQQTGV
ncbi:MAG: F0F1 ATP synthase subunit B' [Rhodobacteraceae bacterium]|nr:MAG: F0F1 ATP synthase subunit B' [Paracoccaceae bacterium]